jgi:hypothetical protein
MNGYTPIQYSGSSLSFGLSFRSPYAIFVRFRLNRETNPGREAWDLLSKHGLVATAAAAGPNLQ